MEQYISKSVLVAEIENLENTYKKCPTRNSYEEGLKDGRLIGYKDALHKINTLEVKEVDLEEEINHWQGCEAFPEGVNITPLPKAMDIVERTAKHFFELGIKAMKGE